jgi:hypothetical protein
MKPEYFIAERLKTFPENLEEDYMLYRLYQAVEGETINDELLEFVHEYIFNNGINKFEVAYLEAADEYGDVIDNEDIEDVIIAIKNDEEDEETLGTSEDIKLEYTILEYQGDLNEDPPSCGLCGAVLTYEPEMVYDEDAGEMVVSNISNYKCDQCVGAILDNDYIRDAARALSRVRLSVESEHQQNQLRGHILKYIADDRNWDRPFINAQRLNEYLINEMGRDSMQALHDAIDILVDGIVDNVFNSSVSSKLLDAYSKDCFDKQVNVENVDIYTAINEYLDNI